MGPAHRGYSLSASFFTLMENYHFCCLETRPEQPWAQLFFAHGAGGLWDHPWMEEMAHLLAQHGVWVRRIEFPYAQWRRRMERPRPPQPVAQLQAYFETVVQHHVAPQLPCFVGGKSLGGRVATLLGSSQVLACMPLGVVVLGYPFHPHNKPQTLRLAPLQQVKIPVLIVQGTRDAFGNQEEVKTYTLGEQVHCVWLGGGDHDFVPLRRSGKQQAELMAEAAQEVVAFMRAQIKSEA